MKPLAHRCSPRDNASYRASFARRNRPAIPSPEIQPMTTAADPADRSLSRPASLPELCAPRTRASPPPWRPSSPTTPGASTGPSGASSTGWCDEVGLASLPAEPLTVARYLAARAGCRRQHRHHPARSHVSHFESPRVGQAGIALPGPGRARVFERDGAGASRSPSASPAPSPPTCSPSSASPRSSPASAAAASKRPSRPPNVGSFDLALVAVLSDGRSAP